MIRFNEYCSKKMFFFILPATFCSRGHRKTATLRHIFCNCFEKKSKKKIMISKKKGKIS